MISDEAVTRLIANLVEEILDVIAIGVGQNQAVTVIVEKRRLNRQLPDGHHVRLGERRLVDDDLMVFARATSAVVLQGPEVHPPTGYGPDDPCVLVLRRNDRLENVDHFGVGFGLDFVVRSEPASALTPYDGVAPYCLGELRFAPPAAAAYGLAFALELVCFDLVPVKSRESDDNLTRVPLR